MSTKKSSGMNFLEELTGGALSFGEMISSIRRSEEESLANFCKKLAISISHLSDIENGRKVVSAERAARFAKILGYSEKQFVRLALQDTLNREGLKHMIVHVEAA